MITMQQIALPGTWTAAFCPFRCLIAAVLTLPGRIKRSVIYGCIWLYLSNKHVCAADIHPSPFPEGKGTAQVTGSCVSVPSSGLIPVSSLSQEQQRNQDLHPELFLSVSSGMEVWWAHKCGACQVNKLMFYQLTRFSRRWTFLHVFLNLKLRDVCSGCNCEDLLPVVFLNRVGRMP